MADTSRSLSACLRCRKQKLKCGGPGRVPCSRCRASRAECVFVAPRASIAKEVPEAVHGEDRLALLEQKLADVEGGLRLEIRALQDSVKQLECKLADSRATEDPEAEPAADIVTRGIVSDTEWKELYEFYQKHCNAVIALVDDQIYPPAPLLRRHPLMFTVVCCIAARALKPDRYHALMREADLLIGDTFNGQEVDLVSFYAIMLLAAWTGRGRLWGYATSVAYDMKLNVSALQLGDDAVEKTESMVVHARAWLTLCSFDLIINLNRPFIINRMRDYLPHARQLMISPFCRPVDFRICAYIEGFAISGDAKARMQSSHVRTHPLPESVSDQLESFDQQVDMWFHQINNSIDPLFQTFQKSQDRNRFMVPYGFLKLYINGLALHGAEAMTDSDPDPVRMRLILKAVSSACLLIQSQWESHSFRQGLRYTIDYNGTTTLHASKFILKVFRMMPSQVHREGLRVLRQASQIFRQAGVADVAEELHNGVEELILSSHADMAPELTPESIPDLPHESLFDIQGFFDRSVLDNEFPMLNSYMLE